MAKKVQSDLNQFPRPNVAVDLAVMTIDQSGELGVLVYQRTGDRAGTWALPGSFVRERERLAHAVQRTLEEKCDLPNAALAGRMPRQLHVFDDPERDERGWVLSVAHVLVLPYENLLPALAAGTSLAIAPIRGGSAHLPDGQVSLPYGQDEIVSRAFEELVSQYVETPDPERFIDRNTFTLSELADVHFAIVGHKHWAIDTFRRQMSRQLQATKEMKQKKTGRPAALFKRTKNLS